MACVPVTIVKVFSSNKSLDKHLHTKESGRAVGSCEVHKKDNARLERNLLELKTELAVVVASVAVESISASTRSTITGLVGEAYSQQQHSNDTPKTLYL